MLSDQDSHVTKAYLAEFCSWSAIERKKIEERFGQKST